ncbi:2-isopropylmalate synthase [Enterococcus saccharolyticus]|uniref:2-isopropylmalate synthase n=1 Tax=Enterococcus saccharolyticus subsp. saccharolyticus ATCC 43076 TaxID=1139996 RepID=S0NM60_9ENTE|nr:2-isopropylmalate synthase [Enterococcus saccharolyticus]EOT28023.1 2-isopropylmalate synthase [Enterococcus saccharolyticus subsp. saccharolyticus ATCC 43076]EOT77401.1 2-isopropylmalate synthase [Enterococcus saccharolyticus subsp. saccharolyticus ATCC 43076]OJG90823.1 2-isopropylmalate synthase [Enterococcus saccharolyticus]
MRKIQFFDTTLRDGEQTPGVNFNTNEKVQIALQLEKWGIDTIEAGFPIASPGDFEAVQAIAQVATKMTVAGLARCQKKDIDCAYEALKDAKHPQLHVFLATSDVHLKYKLKMTREEVLASIKEHVSYGRERFEKVQFSPEDATRTDKAFLLEAIQTAIDAGATIINVPDTVGYSNPTEYGALFAYLIENIKSDEEIIFSSHCHDDLGMATANALAAIENGANRVEGAINGIGERAGNTALEEVAVALHIRKDFYECESTIVLSETKRTSDIVARLSGFAIPKNKAVIGGNAYAHESGIHQDGVLKNPETYEIITPQLVGVHTNSLPLGKLSGRHAFTTKMAELGYDLSDEEVQRLFKKFKELADKKKQITDEDLIALQADEVRRSEETYQLKTVQLQYVSNGYQGAVVSIADANEEVQTASAIGAGSIQAIYNSIDQIFGQQPRLVEYDITALTSGEDAQAEVHVSIECEKTKERINGIGVDFDVLQASAKAYTQASAILKEKGERK